MKPDTIIPHGLSVGDRCLVDGFEGQLTLDDDVLLFVYEFEGKTREMFVNAWALEKLKPIQNKAIPERDFDLQLGIPAQGVELYHVKSKMHWYFRYWYKEGGRLRRRHITGGNSSSGIAKARKALIEKWISEGRSPEEILREFPR